MSRPPTASSRLARRGLFLTTALLGLGLIGTGWTSYRGAAALAETVSQGQAERLLERMRDERARHGGSSPHEAFAALIANHAGEGLRAVALVDHDGDILASSGALTAGPFTPEELGPTRVFRRLGDRMRVVAPAPPLPPPRSEPGWRPPPPPPPPHGEPRMVLEFEPILAVELRDARHAHARVERSRGAAARRRGGRARATRATR